MTRTLNHQSARLEAVRWRLEVEVLTTEIAFRYIKSYESRVKGTTHGLPPRNTPTTRTWEAGGIDRQLLS